MRITRFVVAALAVVLIGVILAGCRSGSGETDDPEYQVAPVQRGDLSIEVTATGNLLYSIQEELSFEVSGRVDEVLIEVGDSVEEGDILARLDASDWEDQIEALEDAKRAAEDKLTTARRQLVAKQRQLTTAEREVTTSEFALTQSQLDLQIAENAVTVIADVKEAQDAVDYAQYQIDFIELNIKEASEPGAHPLDYQFWTTEKRLAQGSLAEAQQDLSEILAGTSVSVTTDVAIEVARKQLQVEQAYMGVKGAQISLEYARIDIDDARIDVDDAQQGIEDAGQAVADAGEELSQAIAISIAIQAPFAGIVIAVHSASGDQVPEGSTVMVLADPTRFEASMLVNEIDIISIREGARAMIEIDALSGSSFPAIVTSIAPTATAQQGVVSYRVKAELQALTPLARVAPREGATASSGDLAALEEVLDRAVAEGRLTREQADGLKERLPQLGAMISPDQLDQMIDRVAQMGGNLSQGWSGQPGQGGGAFGGQSGQFGSRSGLDHGAGMAPAAGTVDLSAVQIRSGLSVTVTIITQQRNNVLLVPNQAIIPEGSDTYVQVIDADGVPVRRQVVVGLSDWQSTEIIQGLDEAEQIVIGTSSPSDTSTQQQQQRQQQGSPFRMFGGGGGSGPAH